MADDVTMAPRPGIHPDVPLDLFEPAEQQILRRLAREWFITSGSHVKLAGSDYRSVLMKPTNVFVEMFNLEREIIVVLSPYDKFQPRTLDAFDAVQNRLSALRVESVCRVLISKDPQVESQVEALLKTDPEQPIVIPFTYGELLDQSDDFFLRNRFRNHFYTRDLFAFLSPLRKDLYFFGRSELIQELVNRHRSGEHAGLFGLRKSGKTSIVYAIERHLAAQNSAYLSIDCESPSLHMLRWYELLAKIVADYCKTMNCDRPPGLSGRIRYQDKRAAESFAQDMLATYRKAGSKPLLLLFDEIERISPSTGSSPHWRDGEDFVYFWQSLRAFYQRNPHVLTYMLVGTNPSAVELPVVAGHENPLFSSIPIKYVPAFDVTQVRKMVRQLGRYMGLKFDELIFGKLTEDFGGHPFLIRQFCSQLHHSCIGDRPITVDKTLYEKVKATFIQSEVEYLEMIVQVLRDWYPEEYDMLSILAQGDALTFSSFAKDHARYTRHLVGYGLIQQGQGGGYSFNIEALRQFLASSLKHERVNLGNEEKVAEVSTRRNALERHLRVAVRRALGSAHGKKKAATDILAAVPEARRGDLAGLGLDELLSPDKSPLYFLDLINVIDKNWEVLMNVFEMEKSHVRLALEDINRQGRPDAHAKQLDDDTFAQLRLHFKKLEAALGDWVS